MFGKYSLQNVMKVYNKNRPLITAYINGQSIEGLNDDSQKSSEIASYGGLSMFIAIVLFSGVQLISIGIIGEYVLRIFFQVKNRPLYIIAELIRDGESKETTTNQ